MSGDSIWALTTLQYMLRTNQENAFKTLENYGVGWKQHPEFSELYQFRYKQLSAKFANKVVQECRGIILNKDNHWEIVAFPYNKFFNQGEFYAPEIDWNTAKVYEKLDGTLIILYYYQGWNVATIGMPDAGGPINDSNKSFKELFWEIWGAQDYDLPDNTSHTYMFELVGPENKVVVNYGQPAIYFHGARSVLNGVESDCHKIAKRYRWKAAPCFDLGTLQETLDFVENRNTGDRLEHEGVIVVDHKFNRVKIKSDKYTFMNHMKGSCSMAKLMAVVKKNEGSEFLNQFPEWKEKHDTLRDKFRELHDSLVDCWDRIRGIDDRKTFAQQALKATRCSGPLFALRDGKIASIEEGLQAIDEKKLLQILKVEDKKV